MVPHRGMKTEGPTPRKGVDGRVHQGAGCLGADRSVDERQVPVPPHDGDLALEEAAGGGARFVLTLPTAGALDSEQATERDSELPGDTSSVILVVDDEPDIAELLEEILSLDGHQTDIAKSGNAALSCLNERRYDLILSDLNMPDLDGPGLYRHLERHHPELVERLVFVTGDTLSAGRGSFLAEVDCEVIEKPFAPDDVNRVVRRVLQASSSEH